ncbi:MAG: hypothetical protein AAGA70_12560 [Pseudomonadota bacterium]
MRPGKHIWRRIGAQGQLLAPVYCALIIFLANAATAQDRPDFATCIAIAMGRFERALERNPGPEAPNIALLSQRDVLICGGAGIQTCDLQDDRIGCQNQLSAEQVALRAEVLASLPRPGALEAPETGWSQSLYPQMWEIAHGRSAGPDCAGQGALMEAWCRAVEINRDLAMAIMTWQMARLLQAVPSAPEAGWIAPAPPPMPVPRP